MSLRMAKEMLLVLVLLLQSTVYGVVDPSPSTVCYSCFESNTGRKLCQAEDVETCLLSGASMSLSDCMTSCFQGMGHLTAVEAPQTRWRQKTVDKCLDCGIEVVTSWPFAKMFQAMDLEWFLMIAQCPQDAGAFEISLPNHLSFSTLSRPKCVIEGIKTLCTVQKDRSKLRIHLQMVQLHALAVERDQYKIGIFGVTSSQTGPSATVPDIAFVFDSKLCFAELNHNPMQRVNMRLPIDSLVKADMISFKSVTVADSIEQAKTNVELIVKAQAPVQRNTRIEIRLANDTQFPWLFGDNSHVSMSYPITDSQLDSEMKESKLIVELPHNFAFVVDRGKKFRLLLHDVPLRYVYTPDQTDDDATRSLIVTEPSRKVIEVKESDVTFQTISKTRYNHGLNLLDNLSVALFGACAFVVLAVIYRNGISFSSATIWTDLLALSAMAGFTAAFVSYLSWIIQPSELFVYLSAIHFFFNTVMIVSLCFHWASVLSLQLFRAITWKSPFVICYVFSNMLIFGIIAICIVLFQEKLDCVYEENAIVCGSVEQCKNIPAANGKTIRKAIETCSMNGYYITLAAVFMFYTIVLMTLGCMLTKRGRNLVSSRDDERAREITSSLRLFYIIIATTCMLYMSTQITFIIQYSWTGQDEVPDVIWYVFIVWFPQVIPPLLLLFLQWKPVHRNRNHHNGMEYASENDEEQPGEKTSGFVYTPDSITSSPSISNEYAMLEENRRSGTLTQSFLVSNEDTTNKLRLLARVKLPRLFDRTCFLTLEYCHANSELKAEQTFRDLTRLGSWICVGSSEQVDVKALAFSTHEENEDLIELAFVAVLAIPMVGPAPNLIVRYMLHCSSLRSSMASHGGQALEFHPLCEFVTCCQTILDAAADGENLVVNATDDYTCTVLAEKTLGIARDINELFAGDGTQVQLSIQTVMLPGQESNMEDASLFHKRIGNIVRCFQYESYRGNGGLVIEDLRESLYSNSIPRQLLELLAIDRQNQLSKAQKELAQFKSKKKSKLEGSFYGRLIGHIQDVGDALIIKKWLEDRVQKRKEYLNMLRMHIQLLVNRDKNRQYFKASIEKNSTDLTFLPINLHIQDLLVGPTTAFTNENDRSSKLISTYEFTTVGAPAAHIFKFKSGGMLTMRNRLNEQLQKMNEKNIDLTSWHEDVREHDDLKWQMQLRMDICLSQAMATLVTSFARKLELALKNPDARKGEEMLRQLSTLGFLYQTESLLSTHGKEIGMIEDMAAATSELQNIFFVVQDVRERSNNRFSFYVSKKKDQDDQTIVKTQVMSRSNSLGLSQYIIKFQVKCDQVTLPEKLSSGGEIPVIPLLFTQGINEMQTIANNTERSKTDLQDQINIDNFQKLRLYCDKYCRLAVAVSPVGAKEPMSARPGHRNAYNQAVMQMSASEVSRALDDLEKSINDASNSIVKTKHPEILSKSSDLCRALGAGRVTVCKSAKDRTAMSVTLEQGRLLQKYHEMPKARVKLTVDVMRSHGVRLENTLKNTGKKMYAFNKIQRSLLPEEYRCPDTTAGSKNVS